MQGELGMRNIISAIPKEKRPAGVFHWGKVIGPNHSLPTVCDGLALRPYSGR